MLKLHKKCLFMLFIFVILSFTGCKTVVIQEVNTKSFYNCDSVLDNSLVQPCYDNSIIFDMCNIYINSDLKIKDFKSSEEFSDSIQLIEPYQETYLLYNYIYSSPTLMAVSGVNSTNTKQKIEDIQVTHIKFFPRLNRNDETSFGCFNSFCGINLDMSYNEVSEILGNSKNIITRQNEDGNKIIEYDYWLQSGNDILFLELEYLHDKQEYMDSAKISIINNDN